jgi:sialidase-1
MLDSGKAGYSDLAVGRDGMLYCLYETNTDSSEKWKYKIVLKRFNLQWLTDGQDISNSLIR